MDKKIEAFEHTVAAGAEKHKAKTVMRVLAEMCGSNNAMPDTPLGRRVAEEQKKRDEALKKRYREVFDSALDMPAARIKYFCNMLLKLWPAVEEGDWESRRLTYDDFFSIYMKGVDKTFSAWCIHDRKTEEMADMLESEYPFPQLLKITKENMGLLPETMRKIY